MDETAIEEALMGVKGVYDLLEIIDEHPNTIITSDSIWVIAKALRESHNTIKREVFGVEDADALLDALNNDRLTIAVKPAPTAAV
jgi:hypothetical protein